MAEFRRFFMVQVNHCLSEYLLIFAELQHEMTWYHLTSFTRM